MKTTSAMKGVAPPADMVECFRVKPQALDEGKGKNPVKPNFCCDRSDAGDSCLWFIIIIIIFFIKAKVKFAFCYSFFYFERLVMKN